MLEDRFYKVGQSGGTYVVAYFFNPVTKEYKSECVRDYDYSDGSRDNDELYRMEINEEAKREWLHFNRIPCIGDTVEVYKGRKIPKGTVAKIEDKYYVYDKYGRMVALYVRFTDGRKTNIENCKLIAE